MTFREVCRLIGSGSDDHNQRLPPRTAWEAEVSLKNGRRATAHAWVGEEIALFVYFDDDGRVVAKSGCFLMGIYRESLNDKLRRWLVPREKIRE